MSTALRERGRRHVGGPQHDLERYLALLFGQEPVGALAELRHRRPGGPMRQRFHRLERRGQVAATILSLAERCDVYIGCAPRTERHGGRAAIRRVWALWADCDGAEASEALVGFQPAPSAIVRSGSGVNAHAYWALEAPLGPEAAAITNRRLALALGADAASAEVARILRPPGTRNHKRAPARPVVLEHLQDDRRPASLLLAALPELPPDEAARLAAPPAPRALGPLADPLLAISPREYVPALLATALTRQGKASCPAHDDQTPSLHAYALPEQGWHCYGCGVGGSVYDLGALVFGLDTRGREFLELRARLAELLGVAP